MKHKAPKTVAMLLLASTMLFTAACGNTNDGASTGNEGTSSESNSTEPITFTFFGADASPNWNKMQDAIGQKIIEETGVTINAEYDVSSGGGDEKIPLMAASGDYPDLIYPKGNLSKLVDAGAMIDLTDLIEEHAPNLKKVYGDQMNRLKYSNEDQSIYWLPTNTGVGQTLFDAGGGFSIQHQVVKELGYPEIKTLEDFENAIREYYEKHPTTADGQPTIPISLSADGWRIMITVTNPAFGVTGAPDDGEYYINPETYEAMLHYKRPEEKEFFRWLNKIYNEGLLDKESFIQKDDQYKAKIASGRVLGLLDQDWGYSDAENALKSAGKYEQTYGHYPVSLDETYKRADFQSIGLDAYGIGITTSCEDPVRAIKFLDWLASDEGQVLRQWGIEGEHYVVEDGVRKIPAEVQEKKNNDNANFTKESGIGLYNIFSARYGDGVKDSTGNYYTTNFPEEIIKNYNEVEKETLAAYGVETWKGLFPTEEDFPVKEWGAAYNMPVPSDTNYNVIFQKTQDIIRKRIPEAIVSSPDQFDQIYDSMLAEIDKAGAVEMEQQYTEWLKERIKLWTGKDV
ncbi:MULTISPECIES: ABC transporter substrate-binding protein [unclassified Paenibacillus]|uniref:ABC transporter substrate-binding protein n=1 Tax=Paenibacillus provencensis TaxID=441151 RepID=A0ABW3PV16_9BACL|nr:MULTISPECIES: ABC transporter substrate-binding protein [unclassified Paenibacillus]MCM3127049.1 ABC transporter substrate-binding protein [Paenibacillus sp. MER 78]SFS56428.1 carbohydrate ABC transporter substrate-binding protein, CUT1 family [Paenibacillus sp. 453mf]